MRVGAQGIYLLAILVVLSGTLLALAPQVPEQYTQFLGDSAILLALFVYALCWVALFLAMFARKNVVVAWRASYRPAIAFSTFLILAFLAAVSWQILAVLRSTDL